MEPPEGTGIKTKKKFLGIKPTLSVDALVELWYPNICSSPSFAYNQCNYHEMMAAANCYYVFSLTELSMEKWPPSPMKLRQCTPEPPA